MNKTFDNGVVQLYQGNAKKLSLPDESVHCVVTSPPYWGLRDYGLGPEGLGLEPTPDLYVQHMVEVFREVRRVLRDDGTLWLNLGDSYVGSWGNYSPTGTGGQRPKHDGGERWERPAYENVKRRPPASGKLPGLKPKDLVGIPWRVASALQADGWWLRCDIIWSKPNPMPESITDRPTKAHEYLFLLTKSERYYYDQEAIREPAQDWGTRDRSGMRGGTEDPLLKHHGLTNSNNAETGRNKRSVWEIATESYPEAHFATFPQKLVEPCILAGTSERGVCGECGAPWERMVERTSMEIDRTHKHPPELRTRTSGTMTKPPTSTTLGWRATCNHEADPIPATVLDPFCGSGTACAVAQKLGRRAIGVDLSKEYLLLAEKRLSKVPLPMRL